MKLIPITTSTGNEVYINACQITAIYSHGVSQGRHVVMIELADGKGYAVLISASTAEFAIQKVAKQIEEMI